MRAMLNRRRMMALAAIPVGLVTVACTAPGPPGPVPTTIRPSPSTPVPTTCTTIDFTSAKVVPARPIPDMPPTTRYELVVTGDLPYMNWSAKLNPLVYIRQPEFWGIEVQGCRSLDVGLPAIKSFTVTLDLQGTTGTEGIEVIGATERQRIKLPPTGPSIPTPSN